MVELGHFVAEIKLEDNLLDTLLNFFSNDSDFIGENGEGFLWNDALKFLNENSSLNKAEFSNELYLYEKYKNFNGTDEELIKNVFEEYFLNSINYYLDYSYEVIYDDLGKAKFISLANIVEY